MSGDGSHIMKNADEVGEEQRDSGPKSPVDVPIRRFGKVLGSEPSRLSIKATDARGNDALVQESALPEKVGYKTLILDAEEFNENIVSWFGKKGFTEMRSFFRASVLNSLWNYAANRSQHSCSELDAVMIVLITDYLLKNKKYFTLSVYTNEVLRPLSESSAVVKNLLNRIGKSQCETIDHVLAKEDVSFVLRTLDLNPHSLLGAEILHRYFEGSQNLITTLFGLFKDNTRNLSASDRAERDDDIVAAFSEGLKEEIGKFHGWFADFNDQFVDLSVKLKKMMSVRDCLSNDVDELKEEKVIWDRAITIDDSLRRQQEELVKIRDKERRKLAAYAKELEVLHKEMNAKLESIQSYEHFLKQKERQMRYEVQLDRKCIMKKRGRGDYLSTSGSSENECDGVKYSSLNEKPSRGPWNVPNTREASTQKFYERAVNENPEEQCSSFNSCSRIMDENLELKSVLREQHLRINALTKRVAALTVSQCVDKESHVQNLKQLEPGPKPENTLQELRNRSNLRHSRNFSSLQMAVRRAKIELCSLKAEKDAVDTQYERMLNNKLSTK